MLRYLVDLIAVWLIKQGRGGEGQRQYDIYN